MVFGDAMTKAGRLLELQRLFSRWPTRSFSTAELAAQLGIAPRTVRQYLTELSASGHLPVTIEERRWKLAPGARLAVPPVSFLLEEAAAVYLAARLLARHSDEPNPAVRDAIRRLAQVVPEDLARFMEHLVERTESDRTHPFTDVFRALATAWATRRWVSLGYHPLNRQEPARYRFAPYLLEPATREFAIYALGLAEPPGALRIFKLERVKDVTLTADTFEPPPPAELYARLDQAWEVWISEDGGKRVALRFGPEVARRVTEARWHASQQVTALPDGGVELRLAVASTVELVPWILGWGAGCEVLEPESLRRAVASEHALAAQRYTSRS